MRTKNPSDNKTTGKYDFTSLLGNDKKKPSDFITRKTT